MRNCCAKVLRQFGVWVGAGERTATIILENPETENREYARGVGYAYGHMVDEIDRRMKRDPAEAPKPEVRPPTTKPGESFELKKRTRLPWKKPLSEACEKDLHSRCMMSFCPCPCHLSKREGQ